MITSVVKKVFGSRNERVVRRLGKVVKHINELEPGFEQLSDAELKDKTAQFRQRLADGESLQDILPEAFATVREVSKRTLGMRHFDVQMIGGMVLHEGNIAEMLTGEGKTLSATLPAYLNALTGRGVHIITVNDYLAKRDAEWMQPIYDFLGITTGVNLTSMDHDAKKAAYAADITYGTNNEFGFDYLRDNMAFSLEDKVQRDLYFAIVDEVDSILIDEARTPLIISGPTEDSSELYRALDKLIPQLTQCEDEESPGDYYLDEKAKQAFLTEAGHQHMEELLQGVGLLDQDASLYDAANATLVHHVNAALRAHSLFQRDVDYIVKNGEVIIVDEHTGRLMPGRRWSDGLHQAVEAKEHANIQNENQTLASITFQNYFRLYEKLAGMTGTADTEAYEFHQIYSLEVIVIPPNRPVQRKDHPDLVYMTVEEKFKAIIEEITACREKGQPVLVGTTSIESSELLSNALNKANVPHSVLNAKQHEREAKIIAEAGRPGAITIATNMAGRGTDIVLGGNLESELAELEGASDAEIAAHKAQWQERHNQVKEAGGLHVLGTERHESRRIDNQLRGRSGRQGDPGSSRFYLSLRDNLLRIFASERLANIMQKMGVEGEAIESGMLTRVIENAQRKVEGHNFDIRKQLLEFDNVANEQRKVVYAQRADLMAQADVSDTIRKIIEDAAEDVVTEYIPLDSFTEQWDIEGLQKRLEHEFHLTLSVNKMLDENSHLQPQEVIERVQQELAAIYQRKNDFAEPEILRQVEKTVLLQNLDIHWKDHLAQMDHLRQGIHLRGYAQKNPKQEYKRECFNLFSNMLDSLKIAVANTLCKLQIQSEDEAERLEAERRQQTAQQMMDFTHAAMQGLGETGQAEADAEQGEQQPFVRSEPKVGRNEPCPCGSGKKYKQCCGSIH
ncbi:MAG: preprotein translocase subunit SecA [Legionellales bacterium]|nr:preprotein translocase subunit SecA [Legionellales bacterium]|tara:strand:+ start:40833 stop:43547 length:2715 start_codon:yes stop_codon:yes gene_type:complete